MDRIGMIEKLMKHPPEPRGSGMRASTVAFLIFIGFIIVFVGWFFHHILAEVADERATEVQTSELQWEGWVGAGFFEAWCEHWDCMDKREEQGTLYCPKCPGDGTLIFKPNPVTLERKVGATAEITGNSYCGVCLYPGGLDWKIDFRKGLSMIEFEEQPKGKWVTNLNDPRSKNFESNEDLRDILEKLNSGKYVLGPPMPINGNLMVDGKQYSRHQLEQLGLVGAYKAQAEIENE